MRAQKKVWWSLGHVRVNRVEMTCQLFKVLYNRTFLASGVTSSKWKVSNTSLKSITPHNICSYTLVKWLQWSFVEYSHFYDCYQCQYFSQLLEGPWIYFFSQFEFQSSPLNIENIKISSQSTFLGSLWMKVWTIYCYLGLWKSVLSETIQSKLSGSFSRHFLSIGIHENWWQWCITW